MTEHMWGEGFEYFEDVGAAAEFIANYCRKYGRFCCHGKEKWGVVRLEMVFMGIISLHSLLYPGYVWVKFPKWLHYLDLYYITPVLQFITRPFLGRYHAFIMRRAYKLAIKKWPHIKDEILEEYLND